MIDPSRFGVANARNERGASAVLQPMIPVRFEGRAGLLDQRDGFSDSGDDAVGQGDVAHLRRHRLAFGQAVLDHIAQHLGFRVVLILVEQHPGEGGDGVGRFAGGVGDPNAQVGRIGTRQGFGRKLGAGQRGLAGLVARSNELAGLVLEDGHRLFGGNGVAVLDVAEGAGSLLDGGSDAVVLRRLHEALRPLHGRALTDGALERRAHRAQVVGEHVGGAAGIGAGHDRDVLVGELDAGVGGGDFRIVPLSDRAHEDTRVHVARQL